MAKIASLGAMLIIYGMGCSSEPAVEEGAVESPSAEGPVAVESREWSQPAVRFADVTEEAGIDFVHTSGGPEQRYILEAMGSGSAFFDADGDGWLDFFAVDGTRLEGEPGTGNRLWRNVAGAEGRAFADVTAASGLGRVGWGMGCAVADYDNDGDLDLYVTYWGPNALFRNGGDGDFAAVDAGVADARWGASAAFGDVDADGWSDLYVTNYVDFDLEDPPGGGELCSGWKGLTVFCGPYGLDGDADAIYRNEGGGFADMSAATGVDRWAYLGLGVVFSDYDRDGDQDIYIANDSTPNQLYRNDGDWRLAEVGAFAGVAYSEEGRVQAGMGLDVGDYDNDGDGDLFVSNFSDDVNTLYQNAGNGAFADATHAAGLGGAVRPYLGWSAALADFDLDGWLDLFVANGHLYPQLDAHPLGLDYRQRNLFYWNRGGVYAPGSVPGLEAERVSRGAAFGDYDNDGDLDLAVNNLNDRPSLLRNDGGHGNNWLGLELVGAGGRSAEGAEVRVWADGRVLWRQAKRGYGYLSASDGRVLVGLGGARAEKVEIRWPSGRVQVVEENLPERRYIVVREGAGVAVADYGAPSPSAAPDPVPARPAAPVAVAAPAFNPDWSAQTYYERATALYRQGRYAEALALLQPALAHYPDDTRLHYTAGVALYSGLGRYQEAAEILAQASARDSVVVEAVELLGVVYLHLNQPAQAVATLERALLQAPDNWQTHYRLGLAHHHLGADAEAVAGLSQAMTLAPEEPMPYLHLARIYQRLGQGPAAQKALRRFEALQPFKQEVDRFRQAIRANPGHPAAYAELGLVLARAGRLDAARSELARALELDPAATGTRTNLANILLRQGESEAALGHFRQVLAQAPELAEAHYGLGMAHHARDESDQALAALERALALRPDFPKALVNAGVLLLGRDRAEAALDYFRRAVALVPDDIQAGNNLIAALVQTGRVDAARDVFLQAAARGLKLPHAHKALVQALLNLAQQRAREGQWPAAIARQRQAIELTPVRLREPLREQLAVYEANSR